MENFKLQSKYNTSVDQENAINTLVENVKKGKEKQVMLGVTGSGKTFVMANMIERLQRPALVLSHNKTLAAQLYEELLEFFPENSVQYFVSYYDYYQPEAYIPSRDLYIEKETDVNKEIERLRFSAMNSALTRRDTVVVASVSCIYNIGDPTNYKNKVLTLRVGESYRLSDLSLDLSLIRYTRDTMDFFPGVFRLNGNVLDIFPSYLNTSYKVLFWGEEIEEIYEVEPLTQKKIRKVNEIEIFPATSIVYEKEVLKDAVQRIQEDLKERLEYLKSIGKDLEAYRLEQKTNYDIEMMMEVGYCKSMENYSIYFDGRQSGEPPYTLIDYFPKDFLLFVDESHITIPQIGGMSGGDRARKDNLIEYGFRLPTARDNRPLSFEEFREKQGSTVYLSATPNEWEVKDSEDTVVELLTRPTGLLDPKVDVRGTENQIDDVIKEVRENVKRGERVLITTLTKKMSEDLTSYLSDIDIKVQYLHSDVDTVERVEILRDLRLGKYDVVVGINLLREGIDLPEVSLIIILDADKEGFLRSKTSLVQTIGRAARHVNGRVIMYANKITESMRYAIDETNRRREYQEEYNKKNNITPISIQKDIKRGIIEDTAKEEESIDYKDLDLTKEERRRLIKQLEDRMFIASDTLQFEKAAELRDQIKELKS